MQDCEPPFNASVCLWGGCGAGEVEASGPLPQPPVGSATPLEIQEHRGNLFGENIFMKQIARPPANVQKMGARSLARLQVGSSCRQLSHPLHTIL